MDLLIYTKLYNYKINWCELIINQNKYIYINKSVSINLNTISLKTIIILYIF